MINLEFCKFDVNSEEGMLLLACVSILTGNFDSTKFGSDKTHDEVFLNIQDLANRIFFEEEYKQLEIEKKRNALIEKLLC